MQARTSVRYRYIIEKCPICGQEKKLRYSKSKESRYQVFNIVHGVDVIEGKDDRLYVYVPCDKHVEEFERRIREYLRKYEKARVRYRELLHKEMEKVGSKVIDEALKKLEKMVNNLRDGEGLVFWVCEGGQRDKDVIREVVAIVVKQKGEVKKLYGDLRKSLIAFNRERMQLAMTHYDAQDALACMSDPNVTWKGYIQGLQIDDEKDLKYVLRAIFFWTHRYPTHTLVDFLRSPPRELYCEFPEIISKYEDRVNKKFWNVVERTLIEQKVKSRIVKKYGVDPSKYPHVKDVFGV